MFLESLSYFDYIVQRKLSLKDWENDFEETKKFLQEVQTLRKQDEKNHYPDSYDDEVLQKIIKINQDARKISEELEKKLREEIKRFRELINILDWEYGFMARTNSPFLLSSDLHSINKNFTLQKHNYTIDIENRFITGTIKNEQNNKLVYFFFKRSDDGNKSYLVPIQSENDIEKIPTYPKYPEEKYLIDIYDFESKLCDLLK